MENLSPEAEQVFESARWVNPEGQEYAEPAPDRIIVIPGTSYEQVIFKSN